MCCIMRTRSRQSIRIDMPEEQWKDVSQRFAGEFVVELTGVEAQLLHALAGTSRWR